MDEIPTVMMVLEVILHVKTEREFKKRKFVSFNTQIQNIGWSDGDTFFLPVLTVIWKTIKMENKIILWIKNVIYHNIYSSPMLSKVNL